ncbi:hypothetical protein [Nitrospirillum viridazoti]|uniref:Secreted protein n=1 Tax=Nitrospirillum amazonense TaxID=28077 RepID=A0A560IU70_9PROT|nr:hypothetical protein [Nitrospirillum amazonense]TWB60534.1 hypothetical protein FBZ92_10695 [Nitrospirillum amazonense]
MTLRSIKSAGWLALVLAAALSPGAAWAQSGAPVAAGPATNPGQDATMGEDIIVTPSFLPSPEEVKAFHDEEYGRLKGIYAPEPPPVSRGDRLTRNNTVNTGTVAGAHSLNCANVGECRAAYTGDK